MTQTYPDFLDAERAATHLECAECSGTVAAYFYYDADTRKLVNIVRCTASRGAHRLRARGKSPIAHYLETGEGSAITRMQAERWVLTQEARQEEEGRRNMADATALVKAGEETLQAALDRPETRKAIQEALPAHIPVDRFLRIAVTSLRRVPKLAATTPASFLACLLQAASVGLEVDTPVAHAHLIPYGNECTLVIGYRGLLHLARQSGSVSSVYAQVVHAGDEFREEYGLEPRLVHVPHADGDTAFVGGKILFTGANVTHAYAVAVVDGHPQFVVLSRKDLDSIRSQSKAASNGPWATHPEEMFRKTALRRLCKTLPLSAQVMQAIHEEEKVERIHVIQSTGEIVGEGHIASMPERSIPPEPLADCPEHNTPWVMGEKGGLFHAGGCTPSKLLTEAARVSRQWDKRKLDEYLSGVFSVTASRLTPDQVTEAYNFIAGLEDEPDAPAPQQRQQGASGDSTRQVVRPAAQNVPAASVGASGANPQGQIPLGA